MRVATGPDAVHTGAKKLVKHVVFIGGNHQVIDRQPHHAGDVASAHVAEVADGTVKETLGKVAVFFKSGPRIWLCQSAGAAAPAGGSAVREATSVGACK